METARFIVCEKSSRWANSFRRKGVLRRSDGIRGGTVHETRSLQHLEDAISEYPNSFVVAELRRENGEALMLQLCEIGAGFPGVVFAVVAQRGLEAWQWPLREAGAVLFVESPRNIDGILRMAKRHLARAPVPPRTIRQSIFDRLPWGN